MLMLELEVKVKSSGLETPKVRNDCSFYERVSIQNVWKPNQVHSSTDRDTVPPDIRATGGMFSKLKQSNEGEFI